MYVYRSNEFPFASRPESRGAVIRETFHRSQLKMSSGAIAGLTSAKAFLISFSFPSPTSRHKTRPESMTSGTTLATIRTAMNIDASGSKPDQPVHFMRIVDMMTPTLPRVSCKVS